jgi:hypothetical protein
MAPRRNLQAESDRAGGGSDSHGLQECRRWQPFRAQKLENSIFGEISNVSDTS